MPFGCAITDVSTLAERLIAAREEAGLTQAELGTRAGVSQGTIGNVENGIRKQPKALVAIASALGVRPQWLLNGKGPKMVAQEAADSPSAAALRIAQAYEAASPEMRRAFDALAATVSPSGGVQHPRSTAQPNGPRSRMTAPAQIIPIRAGEPIPSAVDHPRPAGRVLQSLGAQ